MQLFHKGLQSSGTAGSICDSAPTPSELLCSTVNIAVPRAHCVMLDMHDSPPAAKQSFIWTFLYFFHLKDLESQALTELLFRKRNHNLKGLENLQATVSPYSRLLIFPLSHLWVGYQVQFFDKDSADVISPVPRHFSLHHVMCLKAFFQKVFCLYYRNSHNKGFSGTDSVIS